jgi:hypothetical protein
MNDDRPFTFLPAEGEDQTADPFVPRVLPITPPVSADRIPKKYRNSAGASMLAAGLLGLRDIIDPPRRDVSVREEHADETVRERPIEVYLDPDDPASSIVVIRNPADDN